MQSGENALAGLGGRPKKIGPYSFLTGHFRQYEVVVILELLLKNVLEPGIFTISSFINGKGGGGSKG